LIIALIRPGEQVDLHPFGLVVIARNYLSAVAVAIQQDQKIQLTAGPGAFMKMDVLLQIIAIKFFLLLYFAIFDRNNINL
jgi:hypothetical protein